MTRNIKPQLATAGQVVKNGKTIATSLHINATPQKVWDILMAFEAYPNWNPFITSISGPAVPGSRLKAKIQPPGQGGMVFKPKVLQHVPNKEFRWIGSLFLPHVFDGEHVFLLVDNGDGTTTFHQNEHFRGVLVPVFRKMIENNTVQGFEAMNQRLKERAEA